MPYNLTAIATNTTGLYSFTLGVNDVLMDGWLGTLLLLGLFVVIFTSFYMSTQDIKKSMTASTFILFTLALLFRAIDLISNKILFIALIGAAITLAFAWKE